MGAMKISYMCNSTIYRTPFVIELFAESDDTKKTNSIQVGECYGHERKVTPIPSFEFVSKH